MFCSYSIILSFTELQIIPTNENGFYMKTTNRQNFIKFTPIIRFEKVK